MTLPAGLTPRSEDLAPREIALVDLTRRCRTELDGGLDELGLAAVFESWGITDSTARTRFGEPDVFALAVEVGARVDGDAHRVRRPAQRRPRIRWSWVLRAAAYVPPTLFVVIALSSSANVASGAVFAAITCFGWGMAEALSRVAYTAINAGGLAAVRSLNRSLLGWGSLVIVVLAVITGLLTGSVPAALLVGAQLQYLLLSVVLLPMERAGALVVWISPAMVLATALAAGAGDLGSVLVVAIVCELGATVHTWLVLGRVGSADFGAARWSDLRTSLPYLGSGIAMGAFVLCCTAAVYAALGSGQALIGLVIPLLVSMGLAEIGLRWFQRAVAVQLGRSARVAEFAGRARILVVLSCCGYLAVLLSADLLMVAFADPQALSDRPADYVLVALVGLSLFLTLVLMVMDHVFAVLAAFSVGTLVLGWYLVTFHAPDDVVVPAVVVAAIVTIYLAAVALRTVGHPANHAFA